MKAIGKETIKTPNEQNFLVRRETGSRKRREEVEGRSKERRILYSNPGFSLESRWKPKIEKKSGSAQR